MIYPFASYLNPTQKIPFPLMVILGLFVSILTVLLEIWIVPSFFRAQPGLITIGILAMVMISAFNTVSIWGKRIPLLIHGAVFLFLQWIGAITYTILSGTAFSIQLLNPIALINSQRIWLAVTAFAALTMWFFMDLLMQLYQVPNPAPPKQRAGFGDEVDRISLIPWEDAWKSWRMWLLTVMICATFSVVEIHPAKNSFFGLVLAVGLLIVLLFIGIYLMMQGHYYYQRALWKNDDLEPPCRMNRTWIGGIIPFLIVLGLICFILPANFPKVNFNLPTLQLFLMNTPSSDLDHPNRVSPQYDMLQKNFRRFRTPSLPSSQAGVPWSTGIWLVSFLLIGFLSWGGYLLFRLQLTKGYRFAGFPRLLIKLFIFWRNLWRRCRRSIKSLQVKLQPETGNNGNRSETVSEGNQLTWGHGSRAIIRRGYYHLLQSARRQGFRWNRCHTPEEIAANLAKIAPDAEDSIREITAGYHLARYGPHDPPRTLAETVERLRQNVQRWLRREHPKN